MIRWLEGRQHSSRHSLQRNDVSPVTIAAAGGAVLVMVFAFAFIVIWRKPQSRLERTSQTTHLLEGEGAHRHACPLSGERLTRPPHVGAENISHYHATSDLVMTALGRDNGADQAV